MRLAAPACHSTAQTRYAEFMCNNWAWKCGTGLATWAPSYEAVAVQFGHARTYMCPQRTCSHCPPTHPDACSCASTSASPWAPKAPPPLSTGFSLTLTHANAQTTHPHTTSTLPPTHAAAERLPVLKPPRRLPP